ncbi:MAG: 50S ribosomal protein L11 methyltransferase [Chitinophagaceae bacterium]
MDNYFCIAIQIPESIERDKILAALAQLSISGFEEKETEILAWFKEADFNEENLKTVLDKNHITYKKQFIRGKNWNAEWEANFEPVIIENKIAVRANFHPPFEGMQHEIVITPKMSFGTGHHATTYLMIAEMCTLNFAGKSVFDFGAGTGILSILAEKLGASKVFSIDNDPLSTENFMENIEANFCKKNFYSEKNTPPENEKFDIILANINKHILQEFLPALSKILYPKGQLLISGILTTDVDDMIQEAAKSDLKHRLTNVKDSWVLMSFFL